MDLSLLIGAACVALFAGVVKGAVGFGLPTVMVSGLSLMMPAEQAIAGLIGATLVSNGAQALRQGVAAAWTSIKAHRKFIFLVMVFIGLAAQIVPFVPGRVLYGLIGSLVLLFGISQLLGWRLKRISPRMEWGFGVLTGLIGGVSGIWGPPTVMYLLALNLDKQTMVRIQGVVFGMGAVVLTVAHIGSGILNRDTLPLSLALILPMLVGLSLGFWLQDRLDRDKFLRLTLVVLICAGLVLLQRAFFS